jgi:crotonobetainyl-CoA:carnitine CoA-transferase CaiB-like acyl-CoA transferase
MAGPLTGLRVLDLSRILAGPWAGQLLADFGAEVIKVERPGSGDDTRGWGPPFLKDPAGRDTAEAAYFLSANRGKHSVTIDFARPEGQALVRALAARSDVLIENFKVGDLAGKGLDYPSLAALNSGLVYCSITGFGQDGPNAHATGYDALIQAIGGLMSITGPSEAEPGAGPQKVGVAVADLMAGMYAVAAVLAALHHRSLTGAGQYIDLALLDTQVAWLANQACNYLIGGVVPRRQGTAHPNIVPYQAFATRDGHMILAIGNETQFRRFCEATGLEAVAADPRYRNNAARVAHRAPLIETIAARLRQRDTAEWMGLLLPLKVPCGPINDIAQVFADPQVRHRGMRIELDHPQAGKVAGVANPVKFSATPLEYRKAPPLLGADTDAILSRVLEYDAGTIADLRARGVIG